MSTIYLEPVGGLCNRLRAVFSYLMTARNESSDLAVYWPKDNSNQHSSFLDFFKRVKGVNFISSQTEKPKQVGWIQSNGSDNYHSRGVVDYTTLEPLDYIKTIIIDRQQTLENNYISVHVRRTDHTLLAKKHNSFTCDKEFEAYIKTTGKNKNLYIATDNKKTYNQFKSKFKNKVKFNYWECIGDGSPESRTTSTQDSIVDLFMCAAGDEFMGSGWSSFSKVIKDLRQI